MSNTAFFIVVLIIIFLGMYGGIGNQPLFQLSPMAGNSSTITPSTTTQSNQDIQSQLTEAKKKAEEIQKQINRSKYFGKINITFVSPSIDPKYEYVYLNNVSTTTIPITGWSLKSLSSGQSVTIPKASYLYYTSSPNSEEDVRVSENGVVYVVTGISPNGVSFRTNKCSGYLSQFQEYFPSLSYSCPRPKNEPAVASIPKTLNNDECLDYIDRMPQCRIQTQNLPVNWSYECTNFIYNKINYPSCVDTHKNDADFFENDWRIYLKRSERLWKDKREEVVLYDNEGKVVSTYKY